MRTRLICVFLLLLCETCSAFDPAQMQIAVSIRQYLPGKDKSHQQILFYSGDNSSKRQLTHPINADDVNPVFSPDAHDLAFVRLQSQKSAENILLENIQGKSRERILPQMPAWYQISTARPYGFTPELQQQIGSDGSVTETYQLNKKYQIQFRHAEGDNRSAWLIDRATSESLPMSLFKGYETRSYFNAMLRFEQMLNLDQTTLAILSCHWNSTEGTSYYAVDPARRTFVKIAENGADIYAPYSIPGFFCVAHERYQPFDNGKRTVNCDYLDSWDEQLHRTRFAPPLSRFGGACVFINGQNIAIMPVDIDEDGTIRRYE